MDSFFRYGDCNMKLIIVRHGETVENVVGITQGHLNSRLSEKGVHQAKLVSQRLKNAPIDLAFSSDLCRATDTCTEIMKFHPAAQMITTPLLREQSKGVFEGKTFTEAKSRYSNLPAFHLWHPEGGERLVDVWEKVIPFFEDIKREYADKTVLIVSHGGPISCLLAYLHKKSIESYHEFLPEMNTAVSVVVIEGNNASFELINCSAHFQSG